MDHPLSAIRYPLLNARSHRMDARPISLLQKQGNVSSGRTGAAGQASISCLQPVDIEASIIMGMAVTYEEIEPARAEIDALEGPTLLEFGTPWCGYCTAAQPHIAAALKAHPQLRHLKIEDGPGRPLGRSFRIKLWPTLVLLEAGREIARLVRPTSATLIEQMLANIGRG